MLQTAKNVELELLTNVHLPAIKVLELQDLRTKLEDLEEIIQQVEDLPDAIEELQSAYAEHEDCEHEKDDLAAERDAAIADRVRLQNNIVDWAYANIDNEQLRAQLLDVVYGT